MYKFIDKSFNGDIVYTYVFPSKRIGGLTLERETIPLDFPILHRSDELELAYLEIGVLTTTTNIEWRVKVNGINITREFKPITYSKLSSYLFTKHVYDITSVLKTQESLKKGRVNITFRREGGQPITIEQLSIIALINTSEAQSILKYYTGSIGLEPGEEIVINTDFKQPGSLIRTINYIPSRLAELLISIDDKKTYRLSNTQGMSDDVLPTNDLHEINSIKFKHIESSEKYLPREVCLSNILIHSSYYLKPDLYIEEIDIPSKATGSLRAKVRIVNKGLSKPDKVLLIVLSRGEVVFSKNIKPIEPSSETTEEIVINQPPGEHVLVFRVVWRKIARTWFTEEKRSIVIS